jgi:hypothetical protein
MMLMASRRRRLRRIPHKKPDFATPDPWKESAARMSPADYETDIDTRPQG